jgi:hypothetical protein
MSITPRTDAAYFEADEIEHATDADVTIAMRDWARELECENARMRETLNIALEAAELDYKSAVLDYEEAHEQCVSWATYQKGIRDALRNLLATIHAAMEETK